MSSEPVNVIRRYVPPPCRTNAASLSSSLPRTRPSPVTRATQGHAGRSLPVDSGVTGQRTTAQKYPAPQVTFNYPYPHTCLPVAAITRTLPAVLNFFDAKDTHVTFMAPISTNHPGSHGTVALAHAYISFLYAIVHDLGYRCEVAQNTRFKLYPGDFLLTSGYMGVSSDTPDSDDLIRIGFSSLVPHEPRRGIIFSPSRPVYFKDGGAVMPQPKPEGAATLTIGNGSDAIHIYVDRHLRREISAWLQRPQYTIIHAARQTPSTCQLYPHTHPAHRPAVKHNITFGGFYDDATEAIGDLVMYSLKTTFSWVEFLVDKAMAFCQSAALISVIILAFAGFVIKQLDFGEVEFAYRLAAYLLLLCPPAYVYISPLLSTITLSLAALVFVYQPIYADSLLSIMSGVYITFALTSMLGLELGFLSTVINALALLTRKSVSLRILYKRWSFVLETCSAFEPCIEVLRTIWDDCMDPVVEDPWYYAINRHLSKWWWWYAAMALLVSYAVWFLKTAAMWFLLRITPESSAYYGAFGKNDVYFQDDITVLPLRFTNGLCSDRLSYLLDGPNYRSGHYKAIDNIPFGVILGTTTNGVKLQSFGDMVDRTVFPVVYLHDGVVGHLMMACRTKDRNTDIVRTFINDWDAAYNKVAVTNWKRDDERVIRNGDVFASECFTLLGPTYQLSHYHPSYVHVPAPVVAKVTSQTKTLESSIISLSNELGCTAAEAAKYARIVRTLMLSRQLFVPWEAQPSPASLSEFLRDRILSWFPAALLFHISVALLTLALVLGLIAPAWMPWLLTTVTRIARDKFSYWWTALVGLITAIVRRLNSRQSSLVQGLRDRRPQPSDAKQHPLRFTERSLVSSKSPLFASSLQTVINSPTNAMFFEVVLPNELKHVTESWPPRSDSIERSVICIVTQKEWYVLTDTHQKCSDSSEAVLVAWLKESYTKRSSSVKVFRLTDRPTVANKLVQSIAYLQKPTRPCQSSLTPSNTQSTPPSQLPKPSPQSQQQVCSGNSEVTGDTPVQQTSQASTDVSTQNSENSSSQPSQPSFLTLINSLISQCASSNTSASETRDLSIPVSAALPFLQSCLLPVFRRISSLEDSSSTISTQEMITSFSAILLQLLRLLSPSSEHMVSIAELRDLLTMLIDFHFVEDSTSSQTSTSPIPLVPLEKPSSSPQTDTPQNSSQPASSASTTLLDTAPSSDPSTSTSTNPSNTVETSTTISVPTDPSPWTNFKTYCARGWNRFVRFVSRCLSRRKLVVGGLRCMVKTSHIRPSWNTTSVISTIRASPQSILLTDSATARLTYRQYYSIMPNKPQKTSKKPKGASKKRSARLHHKIYKVKNVRAAVALQTSSAFGRSVLDPAHIREYLPSGIPDVQQGTTLCYKSVKTIGLQEILANASLRKQVNTSWEAYTADDSTQLVSVTCIQDDNPFIDLIAILKCTDDAGNNIYGYWYNNSEIEKKADVNYRTFARSVTVDQIGPFAQRGGYCQCSRILSNIQHSGDKILRDYSLKDANLNTIEMIDGIKGVYSVLRPAIKQDYLEWKMYDESQSFNFYTEQGKAFASANCPSTHASTGMCPNYVTLIPAQTLNYKSATASFNFRFTVASAVQYEAPGTTGETITPEPGVIERIIALGYYLPTFYPASFNDLKKIISKAKEIYYKNRNVIAAALDAFGPSEERTDKVIGLLDMLASM